MTEMEIIFGNPQNLWLLLLPLILIIIGQFIKKIYQNNIFLRPKKNSKKQIFGKITIILSLIFLILALSEPTVPYKAKIADYIFFFDISQSMNAEDCFSEEGKTISRLDFAKEMLKKNLPLFDKKTRIGIGIFTAHAAIMGPPQFIITLASIEIKNANEIINNLDKTVVWQNAWQTGSYLPYFFRPFKTISLGKEPINIVIISDGGDSTPPWSSDTSLLNNLYIEKFKENFQNRVKIYFLGVGKTTLSPVPKFDEKGNKIGFIKEFGSDEPILSGLNEEIFKELIAALKPINAEYHRLEKNSDLTKIIKNPILKESVFPYDISWIFVLTSLIFLTIFLIISIKNG